MTFLEDLDIDAIIKPHERNLLTKGDAVNLESAERKALAKCYDYLNVRCDADAALTAVGDDRVQSLVEVVADITLYYLHAGIAPNNIPELRRERYKEAKEWLDKVADGFIVPNLPIKEEAPRTPLRFGSRGEKQNFNY